MGSGHKRKVRERWCAPLFPVMTLTLNSDRSSVFFTCMYMRDKESLYKFEARRTQPNHFAKKRRKCGHLLRPKYYPLHATIKQKGQSRVPAEEASETHCFEPLSYFLPFILADLCNLILAERG